MCYFNLQKFNDQILKFEWFYFQIVDWWCGAVFSRKANAFQNGMSHFSLFLLFFEALNFPLNLYNLIRSIWKNKIWFFFLSKYLPESGKHTLVSIYKDHLVIRIQGLNSTSTQKTLGIGITISNGQREEFQRGHSVLL